MAVDGFESAKLLSAVASRVDLRVLEVSRDIWEHLLAEIPQLSDGQAVIDILKANIEENVAALLHIFEHDISLSNIEAPTAALECARRLAQRKIPLSALVRAQRMGHRRFLQWCLSELHRQCDDEALSASTTWRMLEVSFGYVDQVTERVIETYERERERWPRRQTGARTSRVREILDGGRVDPAWAESALGYRMGQHHVGIALWMPEPTRGSEALVRLDRLSRQIAEKLGCREEPLVVARDETSSWAWLPFGARQEISWGLLSSAVEDGDAAARVAAGEPELGMAGFRRTHRQARRTQELVLTANPGARVTAYCHVAPVALMCADLDDTRAWVWSVLGGLAVDDEHSARLRETLQIFLATGCSYTATASRQILHKNTVQYRIRKAEEAIGRPVQERRTDLEVSLLACQYLGSSVLRKAPS